MSPPLHRCRQKRGTEPSSTVSPPFRRYQHPTPQSGLRNGGLRGERSPVKSGVGYWLKCSVGRVGVGFSEKGSLDLFVRSVGSFSVPLFKVGRELPENGGTSSRRISTSSARERHVTSSSRRLRSAHLPPISVHRTGRTDHSHGSVAKLALVLKHTPIRKREGLHPPSRFLS